MYSRNIVENLSLSKSMFPRNIMHTSDLDFWHWVLLKSPHIALNTILKIQGLNEIYLRNFHVISVDIIFLFLKLRTIKKCPNIVRFGLRKSSVKLTSWWWVVLWRRLPWQWWLWFRVNFYFYCFYLQLLLRAGDEWWGVDDHDCHAEI